MPKLRVHWFAVTSVTPAQTDNVNLKLKEREKHENEIKMKERGCSCMSRTTADGSSRGDTSPAFVDENQQQAKRKMKHREKMKSLK
jgi:hypothetical protein